MKNQKKLKESLRKEERERNRLGALGVYEFTKGLMEEMVATAVKAAGMEAATMEDRAVPGGEVTLSHVDLSTVSITTDGHSG